MNIDLQIAEDLQGSNSDLAGLLTPHSSDDEALIALHTLISSWLRAVHRHLDDARLNYPLCIRLCDLSESQTLNLTYRGKDNPTNVLSFPAQLDEPFVHDDMPLGDLLICWPVLVEEAREQGKLPLHHLAHLLVHGVLHLLDYDHEDDIQAQIMEALEVVVLAELAIDNPYS